MTKLCSPGQWGRASPELSAYLHQTPAISVVLSNSAELSMSPVTSLSTPSGSQCSCCFRARVLPDVTVSPYGLLDRPLPLQMLIPFLCSCGCPATSFLHTFLLLNMGFSPALDTCFCTPITPRIMLLAVKVAFHRHHSVDLAFLGI